VVWKWRVLGENMSRKDIALHSEESSKSNEAARKTLGMGVEEHSNGEGLRAAWKRIAPDQQQSGNEPVG
jgi:hypothetical protein